MPGLGCAYAFSMLQENDYLSGFACNFGFMADKQLHSVDRKLLRSLCDDYLSKWTFVEN
ncbi:hypothetical protein [Desmonostoc muscorum]|uniref:Uncharacterized protein n=1 Tax=Desmonostoc muscorum LEGE 12446 TaxID=1828758 RepID=A0A8J7AJ27_DESMC|nr:hypothetical protein [Desmonostoc muscorum]